ncbi:putative ribonuclease H-like domain-containing protein [Tanacetum coccineum]
MYVSPPSISIVRLWFATIWYNGEIEAKETLKKSCLPPRWRLLMGQIIQCLGGKTGGLDQISNKDPTILYFLANGVQVDYAKIIWEDLIHKLNKKTREKIVPYPRFISLLLEHMVLDYDKEELTINPTRVFSVYNWIPKPNKLEEPPFTDHMKAIYNLDVPVDSKAPKSSSQTKEDKSPSHPSPPTPVVGEMHKEAQQAVVGPTSLGPPSESALGHDASTDSRAEADPRISAPKDSISSKQGMDEGTKNYSFDHIIAGSNLSVLIDKTKSAGDGLKTAHTTSGANEKSRADDISRKVKLKDLLDILKDTRSAFFTIDFLTDEPIIVSNESEEDEEVHLRQSQKEELKQAKVKVEAEVASMKAKPSYPDINQLTKLLKNNVLFTKTECLVLSPDFKLLDESQVLLKVPRQNNMYSFDLKNVVPSGGLTCLFAKATIDESNLWHRRLGHINFKTMNKLVRGNLVRGLPSKIFENDHTCVACQKGKQHKASCKTKLVSSISQPLQMLHMDLFGPTFVKSLNKKMYCLVVTDDFSRCDNGAEFKNSEMNQFCKMKGIKREFSVARTPQQNKVAERKNRTLIEAARTMLADSLLSTTFWAEAINTACYVQNRVLVTKPHNTTPYELLIGRPPNLDFMKPFGCLVTILNTLDHLGKFEEKADQGFLVGYSVNSKAFRPVTAGNQPNGDAGIESNVNVGQAG